MRVKVVINSQEYIDNYEYEETEDGFSAIDFQWTEGNYSCDCNKSIFLGLSTSEDARCGDTLELEYLGVIMKDGTEKVLLDQRKN